MTALSLALATVATMTNVHPLAAHILNYVLASGSPDAVYCLVANCSVQSTGRRRLDDSYTPLREALDIGWRGAQSQDDVLKTVAALADWSPTETQMIALRRGMWSYGFDFTARSPDLPAQERSCAAKR